MNAPALIAKGDALGLDRTAQARLAGVTGAHVRNVAAGRRRLSPAAEARLSAALDRFEAERREETAKDRFADAVFSAAFGL